MSRRRSSRRYSANRTALTRTVRPRFSNRPLGQIAYADAAGEPVALCILKQKLPDEGLATEQRHGINIVYWSKAGHGYLIAGWLPAERLEAMAAEVARRLPG